jgi:L,D-transpeptidase ErfK/SrfK
MIIMHMNLRIVLIIFSLLLFPASSSASHSYFFSKNNTVIGSMKTYKIKGDESLIEIARKFNIGYNEITEANPELDPFIPGNGKTVQIPTQWILPAMDSYTGILINLSEMRLYFFPKGNNSTTVVTFAIGIGDEGKDTPIGKFKVTQKLENPRWVVPPSIRRERPELPKVIPPGPDNPLGTHALRLSSKSIMIHGTNRPFAVGRKASHGCIRLYPEEIPLLFQLVPNKTKVTIIRQPVKVGVSDNKVYIEVHKDSSLKINYFNETMRLLREKNLTNRINKEKMISVLHEKKGIPVNISKE